ncbi:MAG: hypothetical protein COA79_24445 [Planctomycetota bacterium]|nr:MAG: hypothetical protein COA79_24445 [Planctomycetota bacterium]
MPPTLFEFSKNIAHMDNSLFDPFSSNRKTILEPSKSKINQQSITSFYLSDQNLKNNLSDLIFTTNSNNQFWVDIEEDFTSINSTYTSQLNHDNIATISVPIKASHKKIIKASNHHITISPFKNILILKTIDQDGAGIPWIEASLVEQNKNQFSTRLKNLMVDSPELDKLIHKNNSSEIMKVIKRYSHNKSNVEFNFNNIELLIDDKKLLSFFLNYGSWYNTKYQGISDAKGYMIIKSDKLISGKNYTLYLWSESKDHLKPDKEITFIAQKGITDLGAIKF